MLHAARLRRGLSTSPPGAIRHGWGETLVLGGIFYCVGASMELFMIKTGFYEVRALHQLASQTRCCCRSPLLMPCHATGCASEPFRCDSRAATKWQFAFFNEGTMMDTLITGLG